MDSPMDSESTNMTGHESPSDTPSSQIGTAKPSILDYFPVVPKTYLEKKVWVSQPKKGNQQPFMVKRTAKRRDDGELPYAERELFRKRILMPEGFSSYTLMALRASEQIDNCCSSMCFASDIMKHIYYERCCSECNSHLEEEFLCGAGCYYECEDEEYMGSFKPIEYQIFRSNQKSLHIDGQYWGCCETYGETCVCGKNEDWQIERSLDYVLIFLRYEMIIPKIHFIAQVWQDYIDIFRNSSFFLRRIRRYLFEDLLSTVPIKNEIKISIQTNYEEEMKMDPIEFSECGDLISVYLMGDFLEPIPLTITLHGEYFGTKSKNGIGEQITIRSVFLYNISNMIPPIYIDAKTRGPIIVHNPRRFKGYCTFHMIASDSVAEVKSDFMANNPGIDPERNVWCWPSKKERISQTSRAEALREYIRRIATLDGLRENLIVYPFPECFYPCIFQKSSGFELSNCHEAFDEWMQVKPHKYSIIKEICHRIQEQRGYADLIKQLDLRDVFERW